MVTGKRGFDLGRLSGFFLQCIVNGSIHRLVVVFTLAKENTLILVIDRSDINLGVIIHIIEPVGPNTRWDERNLFAAAERGKQLLADVLICECHELLNEVLFQLIEYDLLVLQFQFPLEGIDIPEPEPGEVV